MIALGAAPPPNDNFENRIVLIGNSNSFTGTLAGATTDSYEWITYYLGSGPGTVWWSWTATDSSMVTLQVLEISKYSHDQAYVTVFKAMDTNNAFPSVTNYGANKIVASQTLESAVIPTGLTFTSALGATYSIQLTALNGADFKLALIATNSPIIVRQPNSQTVSPGESALLTVVADGVRPFGYQWRFNAIGMPGETSPMLAQTNVTAAQAGMYSVVVSNASGMATSEVAYLYVTASESRPTLSGLIPSLSNTVLYTIQGETGRCYGIQISTNLLDWSDDLAFPLGNRQSGADVFASLIFATNGSARISVPARSNPEFVRASRYFPTNSICNLYLKQVRFAKDLWARDRYLVASTDWPSDMNLAPYFKGGFSGYQRFCPLGGRYYTGIVQEFPSCTNAGHILVEPR